MLRVHSALLAAAQASTTHSSTEGADVDNVTGDLAGCTLRDDPSRIVEEAGVSASILKQLVSLPEAVETMCVLAEPSATAAAASAR